ncbi:immunoglobulin domain-containing protein [Pedobacter nyackensis]|nr:hypothetical protein [Pedobacter nyackensis]
MLSYGLKNIYTYSFLLLFLVMVGGVFEVKGQRIYADEYGWTKSAVALASSSVVTPENSTGAPDINYANLSVTTALGAADATIQLKFLNTTNPSSPLPKDTKVYVKIDGTLSGSLLGLLLGGGGSVSAYSGATSGSMTSISGSSITTTRSGLTDVDATKYAIIAGNSSFNSVVLTIDASLILGTGNLQVFHGFYIAPPILSTPIICGGQSVNVTNAQAGYTYKWWSAATGGTVSHTGSSITPPTPSTQTTYTYYVEANDASFSSIRVPITITVNPLPSIPNITSTTICSGTTTNLSVNSPDVNYTYKWYNSSSGGTSFNTGTSYLTPALTTTTDYYVESIITATGCPSATRTQVTATVNSVTGGTIATNQSICSGTKPLVITSTLDGTGNNVTYQWQKSSVDNTNYTNINGATSLTYTENVNLTQKTYYKRIATATLNGVVCSSESNEVIVSIYPIPSHPLVNVNSN